MSWVDPVVLIAVLAMAGLACARGSVWFSSGLAAGFAGLWAADYYSPIVASALGGFPGSEAAATLIVFVGVALAVVGAGWVIRKILSAAFLGFVDRASGFVVGAVGGAALMVIFFAVAFAMKPSWRDAAAVRESFLVSKVEHRAVALSRLRELRRSSESSFSGLLKKLPR